MTGLILAAALAAVVGTLVGLFIGVGVGRLLERRRHSGAHSAETEPLFYDPYCDRRFADEEEARNHAITSHNAPRENDAWVNIYDRPEETNGV